MSRDKINSSVADHDGRARDFATCAQGFDLLPFVNPDLATIDETKVLAEIE
jgi:hypothetical protein